MRTCRHRLLQEPLMQQYLKVVKIALVIDSVILALSSHVALIALLGLMLVFFLLWQRRPKYKRWLKAHYKKKHENRCI